MSFENLLNNLPVEYSGADREMITHAYEFAKQAHEGQKRASGQPYITHCVAVANILSELNVPPAIIIAGLLHDTVEDTGVTLEDLAAEFDEDVAILVDASPNSPTSPRLPEMISTNKMLRKTIQSSLNSIPLLKMTKFMQIKACAAVGQT